MSLWVELKRRNVFRVAAAYVVLSWLLLQVGDILFDALELPGWSIKLLVALLVLGLIPAVIFSWAYELTPEGLKKDSEVDRSGSATHQTGRKLDLITIGMIVLAIGVVLADRLARPPSVAPSEASSESASPMAATESETEVRSIAVLPFLNLSSDPEQAFFSDGLADTLLHRLAQIPDLRVAARTSSFKFKGQEEDVREIARQLGVATVLEGSVQRQGDRVRITAQLIRGQDGSHLWSKVFDDTLDDIFRVQDEIAQSVASALAATTGNSRGSAGLGGTDDLAAYEAYLKGLDAMGRGTPASVNEALSQLELAVDLDPDYALAWVALSHAYLGPAILGTATWESTFRPRMDAARRAIELEPNLAEAHLAMADAMSTEGRPTAEIRVHVERAVDLAPNHSDALLGLASIKHRLGDMREALRLAERAVLVNPLDASAKMTLAYRRMEVGLVDSALALGAEIVASEPNNLELLMDYGDLLYGARKTVEGISVFEQALERDPNLLRGLFRMMWRHLELGDVETAGEYLRRVEELSPDRALDDHAEYCLQIGDLDCYHEYSQRYLDLQRESGPSSRGDMYEAFLSLYAGEPQRSVDLLEPLAGMEIASGTFAFVLDADLCLALAYGQIGEEAKRDRLLDRKEAHIRHALANGLWSRNAARALLDLAAARGDAALAAERLSTAVDSGTSPSSLELSVHALYAGVRDHPDFQAQLERLRQSEAAIRETLAVATD